MMSDAIKNFPKQFSYKPVIELTKRLKKFSHYYVIGMGGSHLAADLALIWNPKLPLTIVSDYGLPSRVTKKDLVIASSYSGNTEEIIDGLKIALKKKIPVVVIAIGGKLIALSKKHNLPYIQLPNTGIQPRCALGFSLRALLKIVRDERGLRESAKLTKTLVATKYEKAGQTLASKLTGKVPVIYSSQNNLAIAYNWKIKLNETGKIPAFYNVLPELNHNEMNGFDVQPTTKQLCDKFHFIFLKDKKDHARVQKRMSILEQLYRQRGLPVEIVELRGKTAFEKMFSSLVLADWTAVYLAKHYGLESEQVPMVEKFKKLMNS
ncbi:bifunctional phosphoglucose/phosphomannose isomerase [Candidatus Uhrbacteria bacterium]|nr:bifunctional phosphoglucose/phosphomannose isomerase [Candidatus Uhrbacteria bacterium]